MASTNDGRLNLDASGGFEEAPRRGWAFDWPSMNTRLWSLVLAFGLIVGLVAPMMDQALLAGDNGALAKGGIMRWWRGDFTLSFQELIAFTLYGSWLVLKPLCLLVGFFLLELRFTPSEGRRTDYLLPWMLQAGLLASVTAVYTLAQHFRQLPSPLFLVQPDRTISSFLQTGLAFVFILLAADFVEYWTHRAQHKFAFLWRLHSIHHSVKLDALHNIRHPLDLIPVSLLTSVPISFILGVRGDFLLWIVAFSSLQTHLNHTKLPIHFGRFRKIFCDNRYHFVHHGLAGSDHGSNFAGRFPVIDMIFGTYRVPPEHLVETGLRDVREPQTLTQYVLARLPLDAG